MKWKIIYYNQFIKDKVQSLPKSIKAKFIAILDKILQHGPDLKKTEATPKKELDLSIKRMKEVKNHDI